MREILESHPITNLKKEVGKLKKSLNYSKLKKSELIDLMMKPNLRENFKHIKMYVKPERKKPIRKPKEESKPKAKPAPKPKEQPKAKPAPKPKAKKEPSLSQKQVLKNIVDNNLTRQPISFLLLDQIKLKPNSLKIKDFKLTIQYFTPNNQLKTGRYDLQPYYKDKVLKNSPFKEEPKTKEQKIKVNKKETYDPSKLKVFTRRDIFGKLIYKISYQKDNVNISASIPPTEPKYFYLDIFEAREDTTKPRAKKGLANEYLCEVVKQILKGKYGLTPKSQFKLTAANISEGHDQEKLNKYYIGLSFKKEGMQGGPSQDFTQPISTFLRNCQKFEVAIKP